MESLLGTDPRSLTVSRVLPSSVERGLPDLAVQMPRAVVAHQLAQRLLVKRRQNLRKLGAFRLVGGERRSVDLAQRRDQRVAVLSADLAVLVAVTAVQSRFHWWLLQ